jgi:hypothetical protein
LFEERFEATRLNVENKFEAARLKKGLTLRV